MQKRLQEIKRRWGDNSGLGFLKGATIDAERVCVCVCLCECVCMHEPPVRLCTMDVCVEMRRSGGSRPDCRNPEVVVAITGRVLHNAPGCSKSRGEDGGVRGACEEPGQPRCNSTGSRSTIQAGAFTPPNRSPSGAARQPARVWVWDQLVITCMIARSIHPSTLRRSAGVCFQLPTDFPAVGTRFAFYS